MDLKKWLLLQSARWAAQYSEEVPEKK